MYKDCKQCNENGVVFFIYKLVKLVPLVEHYTDYLHISVSCFV